MTWDVQYFDTGLGLVLERGSRFFNAVIVLLHALQDGLLHASCMQHSRIEPMTDETPMLLVVLAPGRGGVIMTYLMLELDVHPKVSCVLGFESFSFALLASTSQGYCFLLGGGLWQERRHLSIRIIHSFHL